MINIRVAQNARDSLINVMKSNGLMERFDAKVSIVYHNKDLALKIVVNKKPEPDWAKEYEGVPLIVEWPNT